MFLTSMLQNANHWMPELVYKCIIKEKYIYCASKQMLNLVDIVNLTPAHGIDRYVGK